MSGYGSYDSWKLRSDLDDNPREPGDPHRQWQEIYSVCGTCGAFNGDHERGCPESKAAGDAVDAAIDRMKEGEP